MTPAPQPHMVEHKHGQFLLRVNPVLVEKVRQYRRIYG